MARPFSMTAIALFAAFVTFVNTSQPLSADWPMWRNDAARTACTDQELPKDLQLHWELRLPTPRPAWPPDQGKVLFDKSYEPVVADGRLFVPSMTQDHVSSYDLATGRLLWRFYCDGPVRFAPVVQGDNLLFVSDDGHLYCLATDDGHMKWRLRGGPRDGWLLGNDRLISMWPARGAPVTYGDTVYFAAGIWPFMGIFVHAVDIATGELIWTNSGTGSNYTVQQHTSPAFAGVAPQGYLAVNDQYVLVSGGITVPAAFDRATGELVYFRPSDRQLGKDQGGYEVMLGPGWFSNRGGLHAIDDGAPLVATVANLLTSQGAIGISGQHLVGLSTQVERKEVTTTDNRGKKKKTATLSLPQQWRIALPDGASQLHIQAGQQLLVSGAGPDIWAIQIPQPATTEGQIAWSVKIEGTVWRVLATDQRLLVVSEEGSLFCFGSADDAPTATPQIVDERTPAADTIELDTAIQKTVSQLLEQTAERSGYAVIDSPQGLAIAQGLVAETDFHILLLQPDEPIRFRWREALRQAGSLGTRVAVVPDALPDAQWAPYFAELVFIERVGLTAAEQLTMVRQSHRLLRPYSGTAMLGSNPQQCEGYVTALQTAGITTPMQRLTNYVVLRRTGPLSGAGTWTSQRGDAGNTLVSKEVNVEAPLGMLWFGGPSNREVLPRHGHGPTPQVIGGRLFIEGRDMLRAVDVYTGRQLWQRDLPDVGIFYDNTDHHPGAGAIGGNFVSTADSVYVVWGRRCLRLDPASGDTLAELFLPATPTQQQPYWGCIQVWGDYLIAGSEPMLPLTPGPGQPLPAKGKERDIPLYSQFGEGSHRLVVMDRLSGEVKWQREARWNFRHNAIAVGDGKLFCLDRMTEQRLAYFRRRGEVPVGDFTLYAFDLENGQVVWQSTDDAFGTWLAYDSQTRMLLQAGSKNRDRAEDEIGQGMSVHDGDSGRLLWHNDTPYAGPPMLYPDRIITQGTAFDVLTGKAIERQHPLTGESLPWTFARNYGCCTAIGCVNLLTFRSAAAGYFDLQHDSGTGNFGGFRTGCTANLIPADGVLSAPDYTRTCTCSYQNQCSVALVHMPDVEMWTFNPIAPSSAPVEKMGINFGAPGDRRDDDGTLWLDFPSTGGPSPDVPLTVQGENLTYSRVHAWTITTDEPRWVFASGVQGARQMRIRLAGADASQGIARPYRVRLYLRLADPAAASSGLAVRVQGRRDDLSPIDATAWQQGIVREYSEIEVVEYLEVDWEGLEANKNQLIVCGICVQRS